MNSFYWLLAEKALRKWLSTFPKSGSRTASSATSAIYRFCLTSLPVIVLDFYLQNCRSANCTLLFFLKAAIHEQLLLAFGWKSTLQMATSFPKKCTTNSFFCYFSCSLLSLDIPWFWQSAPSYDVSGEWSKIVYWFLWELWSFSRFKISNYNLLSMTTSKIVYICSVSYTHLTLPTIYSV